MTRSTWPLLVAFHLALASPALAVSVDPPSRLGIETFDRAVDGTPSAPGPQGRRALIILGSDSSHADAESAATAAHDREHMLALPAEFAGAGAGAVLAGAGALIAVVTVGGCFENDCGNMEESAVLLGGTLGAATGAWAAGSLTRDRGSWMGAVLGGALGSALAVAASGGIEGRFLPIAIISVPVGATAGYRTFRPGARDE